MMRTAGLPKDSSSSALAMMLVAQCNMPPHLRQVGTSESLAEFQHAPVKQQLSQVSDMRVLVTGGSGTLGGYVLRELVRFGHQMTSNSAGQIHDHGLLGTGPARTHRVQLKARLTQPPEIGCIPRKNVPDCLGSYRAAVATRQERSA